MFTLNTVCKFTLGDSYESFISQFQSKCDILLCLVNDTLMFYECYEEIPKNLKFEKKLNNIYWLKDFKNVYCVFNREAANIMCANLNEVDFSTEVITNKFKFRTKTVNNYQAMTTKIPKQICIIDQGVKHMFDNYNYPVIIYSYE
jgi:hypothetical protein